MSAATRLTSGAVPDDTGLCPLTASASFADVASPEVVGVGGSIIDDDEPSPDVVAWLRRTDPRTAWTTSVCTASISLAAAGTVRI